MRIINYKFESHPAHCYIADDDYDGEDDDNSGDDDDDGREEGGRDSNSFLKKVLVWLLQHFGHCHQINVHSHGRNPFFFFFLEYFLFI